MLSRFTSFLISLMFIVPAVNAQESAVSISPLPARTAKTDRDALRLKAMEKAGYIYTPFTDRGEKDYEMLQRVLANTDKPGFSVDNHSMGNNNIDTGEVEWDIRTEGPSMGPFRAYTHHLKIQENHLFAFEYMVHKNIKERPGYPLAFNISNPQIITNKGVEFIQPPNEEVFLIR